MTIADDQFIGEIREGYVDNGVIGKKFSEVGVVHEICADPIGDDAHLPIPTSQSGTGLRPPANDDRHVAPALYHQD